MLTITASTSHPRPATALNVAELLLGVREGNPAAWEEIVCRYGTMVFAKVRTFRLQDVDTLDAVQMTWLRLAENAHRIQHPERLGGWLATTASRECLHILRQAKRTPTPTDAVMDNVTDPAVDPEQGAIDAETARAMRTVWDLVDKLPPLQRTLLRALFTDNPRPYTEVARTTGLPPGGIGPTRARALHQLRSMLNEHGLGPGAWL
ncbi:MAG: sigma-70 family RNA polymerase sigma factor [Actinomycetota bacterium]|nr:sigma-70 family RNA polymerase sigma factor [Actinomycetota bacterium]